MEQDTLKIAIAGLMHDIGKLADENVLDVSKEYLRSNAGLYQPFHNGRHTHRHAVYTAAFIEAMSSLLPKELNQANWGTGDSFINLAAGHHNPETPMQWIISIADRVSSGWDRARFDEDSDGGSSVRDFRKTRMLSIFQSLLAEDREARPASSRHSYSYPLMRLSARSIFPVVAEKIAGMDRATADEEYKVLFDHFIKGLGALYHKDENLLLWLEHFESLLMLITSCIPSARAGNIVPDVSLYDHMKTTAALAVGMYQYHDQNGTMTIDAIKNYEQKKFLVVSGDVYGIQDFVFSDGGDVRKSRSKILRGRSFAVSLFSELAADMLCRKMGIPTVAVILSAAGKFTLIVPNTEKARKAVRDTEAEISEWLFGVSYGENSVGIGFMEASPDDFVKGNFGELWERLVEAMEHKKYQKIDLDTFGGAVPGYLDKFRNDLKRPLCPFCGKRPSSPEAEGSPEIGDDESACKICRDHIFLGTNLVKKNRLAIIKADAHIKHDRKLLAPIFGKYQLIFAEDERSDPMNEMARSGKLLKYWDLSTLMEESVCRNVTVRFINGYVPVYSKEDLYDERLLSKAGNGGGQDDLLKQVEQEAPKTFEHVACKARNQLEDEKGFRGIAALGVLKADVDQLAVIFSCGLQGDQFTLSRLTTLSRQFDWFFSLHLPHRMRTDERFRDIYTVFAGGDDLFLIGPWNRIIELARSICDDFAEYVCHNPEIHFSAGITLHKSHTPLNKMASEVETALVKSKDAGRSSITLFGETADWKRFTELQDIKTVLQGWCDMGFVNTAMLYRLNSLIDMASREKQLRSSREITVEQMDCLRWPALFSYTTERNVGRGLKSLQKEEMKQQFYKAALWLKEYGAQLKMALWEIIYNRRKGA